MRKFLIIAGLLVLFLLFAPIVGRKCNVPLVSNGKTIAVAKRPLSPVWSEKEYPVFSGGTKLFSLWGKLLEGTPLFIYPFPDEKRFLCVDDDDTCVLVFVVDCRATAPRPPSGKEWPSDDYLRDYMKRRSTNVVMDPKGIVRLPSYDEVEEAGKRVAGMTSKELRTGCFPTLDLGVYRYYLPRELLLKNLATNRISPWP
ncbi:MAG: hypothetical protein C5B50_15780 [Verrucomicrobia bacterium]|nr:MAG: hypothetical protein C5B50_15780 [Verrucomicrobiota bacterium]